MLAAKPREDTGGSRNVSTGSRRPASGRVASECDARDVAASVLLPQRHAGIVVLENILARLLQARHAERTSLAKSHAMSRARPRRDDARRAPRLAIALHVDLEQRGPQDRARGVGPA